MFILCNNRALPLKWVAANEIIGTKERFFFFTGEKGFNSQVFRLEHNNGRHFIVLVQQYGGHDVPQLFLG